MLFDSFSLYSFVMIKAPKSLPDLLWFRLHLSFDEKWDRLLPLKVAESVNLFGICSMSKSYLVSVIYWSFR